MATRKHHDGDIVYSTDYGKTCPACGQAVAHCACRRQAGVPLGDGVVRVGRATKGRKGKGVTVVTGVPLDHDGLRKLATQLKQKCGSGGTVKDGVIEIQGEHRDTLMQELTRQGYTVKRSGG